MDAMGEGQLLQRRSCVGLSRTTQSPAIGRMGEYRSGLLRLTDVLRKSWFWGLVYLVAVLALGLLRMLVR
jgi:uncharacterized protein involved in exopolysaccharide biosynthesis